MTGRDATAARQTTAEKRVQVHWEVGGNGPALVLLNGWSASGTVWPRRWLRELELRFRVIRIDNRGTGWSRSASRPFTMGDLADDVATVLDAIGVESAVILGLSMGGMVAQELALRHPRCVQRLIVVSSRPPAPEHLNPDPRILRTLMAAPGEGETLSDFLRRLWSGNCAPRFSEAHPELMAELVAQIVARPTPRAALYDQMRAIGAWGGARRLRTLTRPTLVVHGDADPLMPVRNGMRIAQLIPAARYVELRGIGHLIPLEAGPRLLELVDAHAA